MTYLFCRHAPNAVLDPTELPGRVVAYVVVKLTPFRLAIDLRKCGNIKSGIFTNSDLACLECIPYITVFKLPSLIVLDRNRQSTDKTEELGFGEYW